MCFMTQEVSLVLLLDMVFFLVELQNAPPDVGNRFCPSGASEEVESLFSKVHQVDEMCLKKNRKEI